MRIAQAQGRNASVVKYDILTALGVHACGDNRRLERLTLRFITLIVARYNWQNGELSIGQQEIARMWGIDPRSVKREMAKLRDMGWIKIKRPAARGRVSVYTLDIDAITDTTRPSWARVGPDFEHRMGGEKTEPVKPDANVISFPAPEEGNGLWSKMQSALFRQDAALYNAWFAGLICETHAEAILWLRAPSRFHASYVLGNHLTALTALARSMDRTITRVEIIAP